jgi:hypothetical protein
MQSINAKQDSSLPAEFGNFELIASQPIFFNYNNLERAATIEIPLVKPAEQIQLAQDQTPRSERIYKQEVPPAAERELHAMFPQLSHDNRVVLGKGSIFDHLQEAYTHSGEQILKEFAWFRSKENTYKSWDYKSFYEHPAMHPELKGHHLLPKTAPLWVQNYGNFHYGAMAFALGLSEDQALIFAGAAQQGGTERHEVTSPEGLLAGAKNTAKAAILPNHGDTDANDQYRIRQGYEWAQKHATELGIID